MACRPVDRAAAERRAAVFKRDAAPHNERFLDARAAAALESTAHLPCSAMPFTLLDRLQRRFGRFAIANLTLVIIVGQAALWLAAWLPQGISIERIALDPSKVIQGEVWRLVTFLFTPPQIGPIFVIFYFALLHLFGSTLEQQWGAFRYNVFLLTGYLANVAAAFAASLILAPQLGEAAAQASLRLAPIDAPNYFLYGSVFLAFAKLYPDFIINVMFVLPIRIKWLALLMWLGFAYKLATGDATSRLLVLATVFNYLLFFGREHWRALRHGRRRRSYRAKATKALAPAKHTCVVCGLSSTDEPRTLFRYCSKCTGQRCYCPEHIRDHEHVTAEEPASS